MASLAEIDLLARVQLAARRYGTRLRLRDVSDELRGLIAFCGLEEALGLEPRREPEKREERVRVEEERDLDDPSS
jgi:hypothetical protein